MVAFLGWVRLHLFPPLSPSHLSSWCADFCSSPPQLTILHFGSNSAIYPFFAFDSDSGDPYTYRLTATASLVIWATELGSSFIARMVIWWGYKMDVTNVSCSALGGGEGGDLTLLVFDRLQLGLDEFREHVRSSLDDLATPTTKLTRVSSFSQPELVVACIWASIHVLMDILLCAELLFLLFARAPTDPLTMKQLPHQAQLSLND